MMRRYDPKSIEPKWQRRWVREKIYEPDLAHTKRPFYNLMMFPYPSAEGLHVGNMYAFTGADIFGRYRRMHGFDVFEPIGLDGFGIHSENYALKINKHPVDQAKISEKNFYRQLAMIGNGFAWQERLETYNPGYYRWTQWIFAEMFRRGLAYRKKSPVNWCPSCKTVLADEQVISGECERCGTKVAKRDLEQWFFRITKYAPRLLKNLDAIDWSEKIKIAQRNWIGRSEGASIRFNLIVPGQPDHHFVEVFTTRPDTLFGATFLAVSPELARQWLGIGWKANARVKRYVATSIRARGTRDDAAAKTGVFSGIWAKNPATGKKIPVWVADYVLAGYGTGAVMGVPAHDERDFEFAKKYKLPITQVIAPHFEDEKSRRQPGYPLVKRRSVNCILRNPKTNEYLTLDWGKFGWHTFVIGGIEEDEDPVKAAKREIIEETGYKNIRFVRKLGRSYGSYFAAHKKENRLADAEGLLFELVNSSRAHVGDQERELHASQWMKPEEVETFIEISSQRYIWEQFKKESAYTGEGFVVDSGKFSGMESEKAKWAIAKFAAGRRKVHYRLRDWLISRQRYWGPPIPLIFCENCKKLVENSKSKIQNSKFLKTFSKGELENPGWIAVPEKDLPVKLPYIKNFRPTGTEKSPLATVEKFWKVRCPKCRSWARRETDVSDTFLDSAWYYLRYPSTRSTRSGQAPWDAAITKKWFPVDMYIGGAEHAVLHLLYVRFLAMVFHDWGMLSAEEPFKRFRAHGLLISGGAKMSKSRGNVVNPDEYVRAYGADALRMYLMFLGPFEQGGDFRDTGIRGITRFLERVWRFYQEKKGSSFSGGSAIDVPTHRAIAKVTADIENLQYNTAISALMVLLNVFEANIESVSREHLSVFLRLLAPFAPHLTEELWSRFFASEKSRIRDSRSELGHTREKYQSIHLARWPEADPRFLRRDRTTVVIQVNGRVRDRIDVETGASEASVREQVLALPKVREFVGDRPVRKFIYVPGRVANVVV